MSATILIATLLIAQASDPKANQSFTGTITRIEKFPDNAITVKSSAGSHRYTITAATKLYSGSVSNRIAFKDLKVDQTVEVFRPATYFSNSLHREVKNTSSRAWTVTIQPKFNAAEARNLFSGGQPKTDRRDDDLQATNLHVKDVGHWRYPYRVVNIIDKQNMLCDFGGVTIWVQGIDTSEMADNTAQKYDGKLKVTGTKKYVTTAGSSKTVFVLKPEK